MKFYFFKRNRKEIVPVEDTEINKRAKKKLDEIFKNASKYNVPRKFLKSWEDIALYNAKGNLEKANALFLISENGAYDLSNSLNDLLSKEWISETVTVFSQKGLGASNKDAQIEKLHPAPFSFQDVGRLIRFFTKEGNKVLDPFVGVGSTLKACAFENRQGIGIELNSKYAQLAEKRIVVEVPDEFEYKFEQKIIQGDSLNILSSYKVGEIDFVITSPPYWNILETIDHKAKERVDESLDTKYSENKYDLGNIEDYDVFLDKLTEVFIGCERILKPNKYMVIIVSDFRKKENYYVFHADLAKKLESKSSFKLKGIRILHQRHKSIYPYGYPFSFVPNVHHQNVLIFQKT